jgi:hypothetical protein
MFLRQKETLTSVEKARVRILINQDTDSHSFDLLKESSLDKRNCGIKIGQKKTFKKECGQLEASLFLIY